MQIIEEESISSDSTVYLVEDEYDDDENDDDENLILTVDLDNSAGNANTDPTNVSRKRKIHPGAWKKNVRKKLRNLGQQYVTSKNVVVPAREMKPVPCTDCTFLCKEITEEQRRKLFKDFWALGSVKLQWTYTYKCMVPFKEKTVKNRRAKNAYYFEVDGEKLRVCKTYFMATLGIGSSFLFNAEKKVKMGDQRGRKKKKRAPTITTPKSIKSHVASIPRIELDSLANAQLTKKFIYTEKTLPELHEEYVAESKSNGVKYENFEMYKNIFLNENSNIFTASVKKEPCSICRTYKNAVDKNDEEYETHMHENDRILEDKADDIRLAKEDDACITAQVLDLQAMITPCGSSEFLQKRRLSTFNLAIYNTATDHGHCYMWHEGLANCGPNEIGACIHKFLNDNTVGKPVIFYSENAGHIINENIVCLYLYMVSNYDIPSITHKFTNIGHSKNHQVHSMIEKQTTLALKSGPIYVPSQWVTIFRLAKQHGKPLAIDEIETKDILDLKKLCKQLGNNYNTTVNKRKIPWDDIKIIEVRKNDGLAFYVKTHYDENFQKISIGASKKMPELEQAYTKELGVDLDTKKDLLALCKENVIKQLYHSFFQTLPIREEDYDE